MHGQNLLLGSFTPLQPGYLYLWLGLQDDALPGVAGVDSNHLPGPGLSGLLQEDESDTVSWRLSLIFVIDCVVRYADIIFADEEYEVTTAKYVPDVLLRAKKESEVGNSGENYGTFVDDLVQTQNDDR